MSGQAADALPLLVTQNNSLNFDPDAIAEIADLKTTLRLLRLAMTFAETRARLGEPQWALEYLQQVLTAQRQIWPTLSGEAEHTDIADTRKMMHDIARIYKLPHAQTDQ